ncbi:MAG: PTS sugar transporter subunit IIA [Coprobacillus sp.]
MLLPREKRILELLYQEKKELTTNELATTLQISSRTVKGDVKRLRLELESTGCEIHSKTGRGIWLSYNELGQRYLNDILSNDENASSILPETRKYYIALQILDADDYVSMESISELLYVSKGTIMNDVNRLQTFFEELGMSLEKKVKYGIRVKGSESKLRIAKANVVRKIVVYQGNEVVKKLQPFFEEIDLSCINDILQNAEAHYSFILSDTSFIDLITHLSIIVTRIKQGHYCELEKDELKNYVDNDKDEIAKYIADELSKQYSIKLSKADIAYIYMNLVGAKLQNTKDIQNQDQERIRDISPEVYDNMILMLEEVDYLYGDDLVQDDIFKGAMFLHLNATFTRLMNSIYLENPLKKSIKEDLGYEFEIATYLSGLIKSRLEFELQEDDICDLALYIGASLKRKSQRKNTNHPRITVVCGTGMSTSQFIEAKLKLIFPYIEIARILPISKAKTELKKDMQDLILTTVPFELEDMDILQVTPMLSDEDLENIKHRIAPETTSKKKYVNSHYGALLPKFNKDISIFHQDCRSKEEVIRMLGSRLIHEGYVDEGFIDSVFKREQLAPTSIGGNFAIPHSFKGHVLKPGIALMTLKKPITWGNEKVQIILMISLDPESQESFKEIFSELADITKDYALIDQLLDANSYKDIVNILTK